MFNKLNPRMVRLADQSIMLTLTVGYFFLLNLIPSMPQILSIIISMWAAYITIELLDEIIQRVVLNKALKKLGVKSMGELSTRVNKQMKSLNDLMKLPPQAQLEINEKVQELQKTLNEYKKQPDWYFINKGINRKEAINDARKEFEQWMKQKGYPTLPTSPQ